MSKEKIMTKWKKVNKNFSYVNCARPTNLKEARALMKLGYCVEELTIKVMKNYLSVQEYTLKEFFDEYSWRDVRNYIAPDIKFDESVRKNTIWISDREGEEEFLILKGELRDIFEMYLYDVNYDIISEALSLLNEQKLENKQIQLENPITY